MRFLKLDGTTQGNICFDPVVSSTVLSRIFGQDKPLPGRPNDHAACRPGRVLSRRLHGQFSSLVPGRDQFGRAL